jgi:hypothetical protein
MQHKVTVTEADIVKAERSNSMKCVVMQAIARCIPDAHHIDIDLQTVRFTRGPRDNSERFVYLTPYQIQDYIVAFDAGDQIQPFSFTLLNQNRITARRRRITPAGKVANAARRTAIRAARRARGGTGDKPLADPRQERAAKDEAIEAYAAARRANPGPAHTSTGGRKPPPRVARTSRRTYGLRAMRINRES